jgi:hypothetical protein
VNPNQKNLTKQPVKTGKKRHTPTRGRQDVTTNKNNKTKTTKHTIEFSNNRPPDTLCPAAQPTRGV